MQKILCIAVCLLTFGISNRATAGCNAANANNGTLEVRANNQLLSTDQIVYISSAPAMPTLTAKLTGSPSGNLDWSLSQDFTRNGLSNDPDYEKNNASATATWDINSTIGGNFFGGKITVSLQDTAQETCDFVFHIRGTNPSEATVKSYIGTSPWYTIPIAKQESNFLQFNTGSASINDLIKACPNFGPPNGWGIMQLDPPPSNTAVWNWQDNVDEGKAYLSTPCRTDAAAWIASQEAQQQNEEPSKPLQNYIFTFGGIDFRKGTSHTPTDACAIQRYNGAAYWVIYWDNKTATKAGSWKIRSTHRTYVDAVCN